MTHTKHFFGFELLMIIAIIILGVGLFFLVMRDAHDRAEITAYMAYGEQMQRLVTDAVAAGYLDDIVVREFVCLGQYDERVLCWEDSELTARLERLSTVPDPGMTSPYNDRLGAMVVSRMIDGVTYFEVRLGITSDVLETKKVCDVFGWGSDESSYCYLHIARSARK